MSDQILGEIQRSLGNIEGMLESHLKAFEEHREDDKAGFAAVNERIGKLTDAENKRKGERATWTKIITGATGVAGVWEIAKAFWHHQ